MRFDLQPSVVVFRLTVAFALCCALALAMVLAPRCGAGVALVGSSLVGAALVTGAVQTRQRQVQRFEFGSDALALWRRDAPPQRFALAGWAQWGGSVMVLYLQAARGRPQPLLVTRDMLGAARFRELAVRVRHGRRIV